MGARGAVGVLRSRARERESARTRARARQRASERASEREHIYIKREYINRERERESDIERERYIYILCVCVRVCVRACVCARAGVCIKLSLAIYIGRVAREKLSGHCEHAHVHPEWEASPGCRYVFVCAGNIAGISSPPGSGQVRI
jgi:hypothetical protein